MKHALIISLKADCSNLEIAHFFRVARLFVHKICKELEDNNNNK